MRSKPATLERFAAPDDAGRALLMRAGEAGGLTARKARLLLWALLSTGASREEIAAEFARRGEA